MKLLKNIWKLSTLRQGYFCPCCRKFLPNTEKLKKERKDFGRTLEGI